MNILVLANTPGGLYNFRKDLLKEIQDKGHRVYVSIPQGPKDDLLKELGFEVIYTKVDRRGINPLKDIKLMFEYLKIINKVKPDKVITYTVKPNVYGGMACRLKRIPLYANVTGLGTAFQKKDWLSLLVTIMYKFALGKAKTVFFENEGNRKVLVDKKIVPYDRTHRVNGAGVNLDEFEFSKYPPDGKIKFIFMGRIMKEKGVGELFEAVRRLMDKGYNFEVDILGIYEENYKETVEKLQTDGYVKYHGFQTNVKPFIQNAHCSVLPSYHEGMSNTLLESASMGRPLITSDIHGCKEAVINGKSGFLCEKKSAEDLYDKMEKFIKLPYEDKVAMGKASREHMEKVFDKRKVVDETMKKIFG